MEEQQIWYNYNYYFIEKMLTEGRVFIELYLCSRLHVLPVYDDVVVSKKIRIHLSQCFIRIMFINLSGLVCSWNVPIMCSSSWTTMKLTQQVGPRWTVRFLPGLNAR